MKKKDPRESGTVERKVGAKIRKYRRGVGMSQTDLGRVLGITFQQVQKYEKGVNRVAFSRMIKIAKVLQQPLDSFLPD